MSKVTQKLKWCKVESIKSRKRHGNNTRIEIELLKREMEQLQRQEGERNWEKWRQLQAGLDEAYKAEEEY